MDEAEGLSEENRALVERVFPYLTAYAEPALSWGTVNDLLNAARAEGRTEGIKWQRAASKAAAEIVLPGDPPARAESRSTPDRELAPVYVGPYAPGSNEWWFVRRVATSDVRRKWYQLTDEDRAALARPASSAGGVEEALAERIVRAIEREEQNLPLKASTVTINVLRDCLALTSKGADRG